jgi:hypothetical protein
VTGDLVHLKVKDIKTIEELPKLSKKALGKRKKRDCEEEEGMWKKKSIMWELEYWPMLDARHSIDNMHVKKNVCEATCGTLLQQKSKGNKDGDEPSRCCNHLVKGKKKRILSVFA